MLFKLYMNKKSGELVEILLHEKVVYMRGEDYEIEELTTKQLKEEYELIGEIYKKYTIVGLTTLLKVNMINGKEHFTRIDAGIVQGGEIIEGVSVGIHNPRTWFRTSLTKSIVPSKDNTCYDIYTLNSHYRLVLDY